MRTNQCALVLLFLCTAASTLAQQRYSLEIIGPPDPTGGFGVDITNSGIILAKTALIVNMGHTFVIKNGQTTFLAPDAAYSYGKHITEDGAVALEVGDRGPFIWKDGTLTSLPPISPGKVCNILGLNSFGQAVGYSGYDGGNLHATVWKNGVPTDLGVYESQIDWSEAAAINDRGQIAGNSTFGDSYNRRPVLWENGQMRQLALVPGVDASYYVNAINENGVVAGAGIAGAVRGLLWKNDTVTILRPVTASGDNATALDLNIHEQVVGISGGNPNFYSGRATLWENGVGLDLNDYVNGRGLWTLKDARGINDYGQIVGTAYDVQGNFRAYVLNPVPEPATLLSLGFGALLMQRSLRKQRR